MPIGEKYKIAYRNANNQYYWINAGAVYEHSADGYSRVGEIDDADAVMVYSDYLYIFCCRSMRIYRYNIITRDTDEEYALPYEEIPYSVVVDDDGICVMYAYWKGCYYISFETAEAVYLCDSYGMMSFSNGALYFLDGRKIYAYDSHTAGSGLELYYDLEATFRQDCHIDCLLTTKYGVYISAVRYDTRLHLMINDGMISEPEIPASALPMLEKDDTVYYLYKRKLYYLDGDLILKEACDYSVGSGNLQVINGFICDYENTAAFLDYLSREIQ